MTRAWIRAGLVALALFSSTASVQATSYTWANAVSGDFTTKSNWLPLNSTLFRSQDTAKIDQTTPIAVTVNSKVSISSLTIANAATTLNLANQLILANSFVSPGTLNFEAGNQANTVPAGYLEYVGSLVNSGTLNMGARGEIDALDQVFLNTGTVNLLAPPAPPIQFGWFDHITAKITNQGSFHIFGGQLNVELGREFSNEGTFLIDQGASVFQLRPITNQPSGVLTGSGSFGGQVINHGLISPGATTGRLSIEAFQQAADGVLRIDIGGQSDYDQLVVTPAFHFPGDSPLNGWLSVSFLDGFVPDYSDTFTIISGAHTGRFLNTIGDVLHLPRGNFDVIYTPTAVVLTHFIPEPGTWQLLIVTGMCVAPWMLRRKHRLGM
ncbi:MAG TPA: hypothetical protein VL175_05770 [Pirellulales bacterium]|jgi:hypothetical protein|nr:hypothetical protein [Pirellulales bacterium]